MKNNRRVSLYILIGLLVFAAAGLLAGLYAGLVRLGMAMHPDPAISPMAHGPLMVNGFLGTLIGLERAAALEKKWAYLAPVLLAASTVLNLAGWLLIGKILLVGGSLFLFIILIYLYSLQPEVYHIIMALGGGSLFIGNMLFLLGFPIYDLVAWWVGFPLLTIFGERLELNRIMRPPKRARLIFTGLVVFWIAGIAFIYFNRRLGWTLASAILILQALWLFRYDVARRTIRAEKWTRYSAVCLLTGYAWLVVAGGYGIWFGFPAAGPIYDGLLHSIFVGFVFSMIFAHASVIIPSLSGRIIPYHTYFYLPLILLHGFLLVRVIGDVFLLPTVRKIGGHGNVLAILLFLGGVVFQLIKTSRKKRRQPA